MTSVILYEFIGENFYVLKRLRRKLEFKRYQRKHRFQIIFLIILGNILKRQLKENLTVKFQRIKLNLLRDQCTAKRSV